MDIKKRLLHYIECKGLNKSAFEKQAGLSNGYINSIKGNIGTQTLETILRAFPDMNRDWLFLGKGQMLNTGPEYPEPKKGGLSVMKDIRGEYIVADGEKHYIRIYDPDSDVKDTMIDVTKSINKQKEEIMMMHHELVKIVSTQSEQINKLLIQQEKLIMQHDRMIAHQERLITQVEESGRRADRAMDLIDEINTDNPTRKKTN